MPFILNFWNTVSHTRSMPIKNPIPLHQGSNLHPFTPLSPLHYFHLDHDAPLKLRGANETPKNPCGGIGGDVMKVNIPEEGGYHGR